MKTIKLKNGIELPNLGIGTWYLGENPSTRIQEIEAIRYGLDYGLKLIDTAEMYGNGQSEQLVGEAIKGYNREDIFLVSKVLPQNASHDRLENSLNTSLRNLDTDYIDLYLYHWRGRIPLEETLSELEKMRSQGKIGAWGVSNFDTDDMQDLFSIDEDNQCLVNQVLYNLGERGIEYSLKPLCDSRQISIMAYCPLAQAGRIQDDLLTNPVLIDVAKQLGIDVYRLLISFIQEQGQIIPIPRTSNILHMRDNCKSLEINIPNELLDVLEEEFPKPKFKTPLAIQ